MAKTEKKTTVRTVAGKFEDCKGEVLVLGIYEGTRELPKEYGRLDDKAGQVVRGLLRLGDFGGKANETAVLYSAGTFGCKRIMLVGLGPQEKTELNTLRQAAGTAVRVAEKLGAANVALAIHAVVDPRSLDAESVGQAISEGAIVGRYDYRDYQGPSADDKTVDTMRVEIVEPKAETALKLNRGRKVGVAMAEGQNRTRSLANKPGNEINPPTLAREVKRLAGKFGLKCRVFDERQLATMGMNAILAVGGGSVSKPRLMRLEYNGRHGRSAQAGAPDVVLVGKAITFDSGGLSLKPSQNMETMKFDKSGGCNVVGIMTALAEMKLPLQVVGLIPSAENLPSQTSYRPGDIVRTYNGKTVEVLNTDAEGRVLLSDALAYAAEMKPRVIVDMATLTGACVIALGEHHAGLFTNDAALGEQIERAARASGEPVWPMPSGPEYLEQMKSKVADLRNIGGREGASCTAAAFLGEFVGKVPWAHIDIAAMADTTKEKPFRAQGGTGFGVRLVLEYLRSLKGK